MRRNRRSTRLTANGKAVKIAVGVGVVGVVLFVGFLAVRSAKAQDTTPPEDGLPPPIPPPPGERPWTGTAQPGDTGALNPDGSVRLRSDFVRDEDFRTSQLLQCSGSGPNATRCRQQATALAQRAVADRQAMEARAATREDIQAAGGWLRVTGLAAGRPGILVMNGRTDATGAAAWDTYQIASGWNGTPPTGFPVYPVTDAASQAQACVPVELVDQYSTAPEYKYFMARCTVTQGAPGAGTAVIRRAASPVLTSTPPVAILARTTLKGLLGLLT